MSRDIKMSDSIRSKLDNALAALSETTTRCIWDPVDFDSDWYRSEVEICRALCYDLPENVEFKVRATQDTSGSGPLADVLRKVAKQQPRNRSASLEEKVQCQGAVRKITERFDEQWEKLTERLGQQTQDLLELVQTALDQWSCTMYLLSILVDAEQVGPESSAKCMDRINLNLWHLQLHRNGLSMEPNLRKQTVSHLRFMAKQFKINTKQGGQDNLHGAASTSTQKAAGTVGASPNSRVRKTRPGQAHFARMLADGYKCERYDGHHKERWCPVTKDWIPAAKTIAAHIVPFSLGDDLAQDLFGVGTTLMDIRNGLYLHEDVEAAFDNAQMVIIHNHTVDPPGQILEAYVIDQTLLDKSYGEGKYKWEDIHKKKLQFRHGVPVRPARRYLYFHMLFAMIRLSIHQPPNWVNSIPELTTWPMYPTNAEYLQRGILLNIVRVIGDPEVEEKLVNYIPRESPLQSYSPFPVNTIQKSHETSAETLGWMSDYQGLQDEP